VVSVSTGGHIKSVAVTVIVEEIMKGFENMEYNAFGPQGSGKGTQAELLEKYGIEHLDMGQLLRERLKINQSQFGKQ